MPRYALKIEYHGGAFSGWQRQKDHPSVQGAVEAALRRLEPDMAGIAAAGRTDAGVHATAQVAHCDMARDWDPFRLSEAVNYHLKPHLVAVIAAARVAEDWHARFSAVERRYLYRMVCRRAPLTHARGLAWRVRQPLDVAAMRERIEKANRAPQAWDVKHMRGGLVDVEFLAQYLILRHARSQPEVIAAETPEAFRRLAAAGVLAALDLPLDEALLAEHDRGIAAIDRGGMADGVARFADGAGRGAIARRARRARRNVGDGRRGDLGHGGLGARRVGARRARRGA